MANLTTKIIAAILYPDWVRLTRRGSIKLEKGTHSIEIPDLPKNIKPDSIQVTLFGAGNSRLLGVQLKHVINVDQLSEVTGQLENEIEKMQDELKQLDDKTMLIKQNRIIVDKLADQTDTYASALASGGITIEKQLGALNKLRSQAQILDDEAHLIQINYRKTEHQLEELKSKLENVHHSDPHESYTAIIDIELIQNTEITIEFSYVVFGVIWKPLYDLRMIEKGGNPALEVTYLADVIQNTGNNWDEISLTLSTSRPALNSSLPELEPWFIPPSRHVTARMSDLPQSFSLDEKVEPQGVQLTTQISDENSSPEKFSEMMNLAGNSVSYVISQPISIPSDNSWHKVTIANFSLIPELDYISTPKLSQAVYRQAKIENDSIYTLLPGEANIIIGDEYVGTTPIELTVPGGKIDLFLGIDNRIKVMRELVRRDIDGRMLSSRRRVVLGYEIKLESMLHNQASITIYDQIPIPDHEDIKVKLEMANPKPVEHTNLNKLVWTVVLEPKQKQTLRFDFSVDLPQDMNIAGFP
jgi:uncharacterized protein (TIGR02231 family)